METTEKKVVINENAKKFLAALRSGEYEQVTGTLIQLKGDKTCHCAMGVACELGVEAGILKKSIPEGRMAYIEYLGYTYIKSDGKETVSKGIPPKPIEEWLGMTHKGAMTVMELNDGEFKTLPEIADYIEAHPEEFFEPEVQ